MNDLVIREATDHDLGRLTEIYNYYVKETHITFDLEPVTADGRRTWFEQYNNTPRHRLLVGEVDGHVIGYASSGGFRGKLAYDLSVETTIYLDIAHQGKGFGGKLYRRLLRELENTDVHRCYAIIALPNEGSIALHESLGFTEVGRLTHVGYKFDRFWDTLYMEKRMEKHPE